MTTKARRKSSVPVRNALRTNYHHGELVTALVGAGRALLEEAGAGELSLREAARRVGVSQTAPLHYFGSKAGLLAAIAAEGYRELASIRKRTTADIADPDERLKEHIRRYVKFARANKGLFQLMFGPGLNRAAFPELREAALDSYAGFATDIGSYVLAAGWNKSDVALATATAWSLQHGLASLFINLQVPVPMDPLDETALIDRAASVLVSGLHDASSKARTKAKSTVRKSTPAKARKGFKARPSTIR